MDRGDEQSKRGKKYTSLFIAISPIGRTFCWGGCLPRTSNSVCSTHFIFKPECRFYSWDVIGPVWAGMGKLTSEIFTSWKGPCQSRQVDFKRWISFPFPSEECNLDVTKKGMDKVWEALRAKTTARHYNVHSANLPLEFCLLAKNWVRTHSHLWMR